MLKKETLQPINDNTYEEPDGELVELISENSNTISVLTRVTDDDPEVIPGEYSVSDLKKELESASLSQSELKTVYETEANNKNRMTAKEAIEKLYK